MEILQPSGRAERKAVALDRLELRYFAEVEVAHFHGRNNHLERFFPGSAHRRTKHLNVRKHFDNTLIEPEISDSAGDASILDEERAVARHACKDFFVRIHFAYIPGPRHQDAAL